MVTEIEKELVSVLLEAKASGDSVLMRCCMLSGVKPKVSASPYAPDVVGDSEEERTREMDRMVNDTNVSIEQARLLRLYLAVKGHLWSQYLEGYNFQFGRNVTRDYGVALYWYTKAAERGEPWAQNNLGVLYADGLGVEADQEKAVYWYMRSAENGDETAKGNLGQKMVEGSGLKRCYQKAAKLLKDYLKSYPYSAKHHRLLAECYEHGVGGRNGRRLAQFHYCEAADFGSEKARKALKRLGVRKEV